MKNKFILIEGTDNVGKTTLSKNIIKNCKETFHTLHYTSLPFKDDTLRYREYAERQYDEMFKFIQITKNSDLESNFIFDRSHLGECVYGPLYRKYSGDYVFNIEKKYNDILNDRIYLVLLIDDPLNIFNRDDKKSNYKNPQEIKKEQDNFIRAYGLSNIKNKLCLDISNMSVEEPSKRVINFLKDINE